MVQQFFKKFNECMQLNIYISLHELSTICYSNICLYLILTLCPKVNTIRDNKVQACSACSGRAIIRRYVDSMVKCDVVWAGFLGDVLVGFVVGVLCMWYVVCGVCGIWLSALSLVTKVLCHIVTE